LIPFRPIKLTHPSHADLHFCKRVFLGAASVMKDQQLSGGDRLVGHDDL